MKIKHHDFHIESEHPFTNCKLGREKYANILTQIVGNYKDGFVLAINNEWGTGKTTFVKMWQQQLVNKGYNTLYFNSWENDFDANPLVAIMSELKTLTKKDSKTFKSLVTKGAVLSKNILPQLLKVISKKYVGTDDLADLVKDSTEGVADLLTDEIKEYANKKKNLKAFKENLEKYITETNSEKPLIFIIDELDRCRPNYAVELLEQIKHLFSVPGIVFVLSIDKIQLGHAVRGVYGSEKINADEYLRRFIDVEYTIPKPNTKDFCNYLYDYFEFDSFLNSDERKKFDVFEPDKKAFLTISSVLFKKTNCSLRQQEKILSHCRIGLALFKNNEFIIPDLYFVLVFIKNFDFDFYNEIKLKAYTPQELINKFSVFINTVGLIEEEIIPLVKIEAKLVYFYNNSLRGQNTFIEILASHPANDEKTTSLFSRLKSTSGQNFFLINLLNLHNHQYIDGLELTYLLNKIDLAEDIVIQ